MRRTFAQAAAGRQFVDDDGRCRPPEGAECHHLGMPRRALPVLFAVLISVGALGALAALGAGGSDGGASSAVSADGDGASAASSSTTTSSTSTTTTTAPIPSSDGDLALTKTVTGDISPKSVVASERGLVFAQNMMYRHTITVYDRNGNLVKTIPDTVDLAQFGIPGHPGPVQGAPVEAAFTPDGTHAYVSNYSMYGQGFGPEGDDDCPAQNSYSNSFLYRIDVAKLAIDAVVSVGKVPKYVAVTPNGKYVLATNWCSYDLSVVDAATGQEVKRLPMGPYPRGIVVSPDSTTAYVAVMGTHDIARVDLTNFDVGYFRGVGGGPRHLVLSPDGKSLYVTLNADGQVAKLDAASGAVQYKVSTGNAPRSMAISADGKSLYVVNYESGTMSKLDANDMHEIQTVQTAYHPIGVTYDRTTGAVWVANYGGSIEIFGSA
jgi:YVTN family beta-propeller protein